jgi:hypothetical protein
MTFACWYIDSVWLSSLAPRPDALPAPRFYLLRSHYCPIPRPVNAFGGRLARIVSLLGDFRN